MLNNVTQATFAYMAGADMQTKRTMMKMNNAQRNEKSEPC